tara:strand:- start:566 stop:826 length:261 start_codon:yes stop_codon:yes gene_type:complete
MNAKMIVILMMAVLVALFVWSRWFRKKEQCLNKLEIDSFESLQKWLLDKSDENKNKAIQASAALSMAHGMSPEKANEQALKQIESL